MYHMCTHELKKARAVEDPEFPDGVGDSANYKDGAKKLFC